ncbi:MAG: spherulation-specific family 4 protein, partial [Nitrososphaerales archaeon]
GIFFDEMSNVPGNQGYYSALSNYAKSIGFEFTVGNPGGPVPTSYIGSVDCIVAYENQSLPSISSLSSLQTSFSKNGLAAISYGVNTLSTSYTSSVANYVGYIYVTNAGLPNPYSELPPYFSSLVASLDTSNATLPSTVTSTATGTRVVNTTPAQSATDTRVVTTSTSVPITGAVTSTPFNSTAPASAPAKTPVAMSATTILFLAVAFGASALAAILTIPKALSKKTRFGLLLRKRNE